MMIRAFLLILSVIVLSQQALAKNIPVDTAEHIYGLGVDSSYASAQKAALADIAQKLSSRVQSSTEIVQRKEGTKASTSAKSSTRSYSRDIELPNVEVIENKEKNGQWTIVVKAKREHVQKAIKHQLNFLNEELLFALDEFDKQYGPACFYALTEKKLAKGKLVDLIPAYVGSGINDGSEQQFYQTAKQFDSVINRCEKRNKYRLSFSIPVSKSLENEVKNFLKSQGYIVTKSPKNTGEIQINLKIKQSFAFKNHLTLMTAQVLVQDEFEEVRADSKFKVKGSSFESKEQSLARAHQNLIKKLKSII